MRLGFACSWDSPPELTWSHTPWQLRTALRAMVDVVDVGLSVPNAVRLPLKAFHARRVGGRWVSLWKHSTLAVRYGEHGMRRNAHDAHCDVILQIQDIAIFGSPYLVLQDLSYDILLDESMRHFRDTQFPTLGDDRLRRLRDRQHRVYQGAAGILAMSRWFADHLVRVTGARADRVHVLHPGASAAQLAPPKPVPHPRRPAPRRRLLFVGRDFHRKGGDLVVAALGVLRAQVDPHITLTVIGPTDWPLPGEPPDGVRFLGRRSLEEVGRAYSEHDVFVMPSRFEAFGIALVEALARGMPCVARDAFAMPEIVRPGDNGELVTGTDPHELAGAIARVLTDDAMFARVARQAEDVRQHFSWRRAAEEVLDIAGAPTAAGRPR